MSGCHTAIALSLVLAFHGIVSCYEINMYHIHVVSGDV